MSDYVLPHSNPHEEERLALMSRMLDPQFRFRLLQAGVGEGWRCFEAASGNGSISAWLAETVGPSGHVVTSDIDTRFLETLPQSNLEVRRIDLTKDEIGEDYDLVCGRAFLHHIPERMEVVARLARAVKPGGVIVIEEPDFHPVLATDSPALREFWEGFLAWSADQGIDYFVGRRLAGWLGSHGIAGIQVHGETILFNGKSLTARYWKLVLDELGASMRAGGFVSPPLYDEVLTLLDTDAFWTWQNSYVTTQGARR